MLIKKQNPPRIEIRGLDRSCGFQPAESSQIVYYPQARVRPQLRSLLSCQPLRLRVG